MIKLEGRAATESRGGIGYRNRVHTHTSWRDKAADYGAEYATQ